jgi:hypothetical protein
MKRSRTTSAATPSRNSRPVSNQASASDENTKRACAAHKAISKRSTNCSNELCFWRRLFGTKPCVEWSLYFELLELDDFVKIAVDAETPAERFEKIFEKTATTLSNQHRAADNLSGLLTHAEKFGTVIVLKVGHA